MRPVPHDIEVDVAIVGFGPVGQALAALLGRAGHSVLAVERFAEIYRMPRAVHLDHEIMRLLQGLDVVDKLAGELLPVRDYHWYGADGEPLMTLQAPVPAASGWDPDYMFFQPALEQALERRASEQPSVAVKRGWVAEALAVEPDHALLSVRRVSGERPEGTAAGEARSIRARWVLGADGANSFVREARGIGRRDLGFRERWLVVDLEPHDMDALDLPPACQWCDPARPTTHIQSGTRHRRWEFMLLPGEDPADFEDPAQAWELLAPWFTPADGTLIRHAVYEFRSMLAERMRDGRALLVGDAAHLTPPFLGQGLCSGLRDAANVAWKLDLVLRGVAGEALLDTVEAERQPQNEWVITLAVELGRVLCQLDPDVAAERDAALRAAGAPPVPELAPLTGGLLRRGADDAPGPLAGHLSVQGLIATPSGDTLLDEVTGGGFTLIAAAGDPLQELDGRHRALLDALGAHVVSLDPDAGCAQRDADGRLTSWLREHGAHAVLVRPDFYVFGSAASATDLPALIDELRDQLPLPTPA
ncbi:MAG: bifunctional 3-(3-hydroxy-phenyl)propionate/3-hydroxycinnamic acid hydroxylase [Solirubrobacteraceae bacterium]